MPGQARLAVFAVRALVALLLLSVLSVSVAGTYTGAVAAVSDRLTFGAASVGTLESHLLVETPDAPVGLTVNGLTLQFGLVLLGALVLAAVGMGAASRAGWLIALGAAMFVLHTLGVAAVGAVLAAGDEDPASGAATRVGLSLYAAVWALTPAVLGGVWCLAVASRTRDATGSRPASACKKEEDDVLRGRAVRIGCGRRSQVEG